MTQMIQLSRATTTIPVENEVQQNIEVGDVIEGEVVDKSSDLTSVLIDDRIVKLASDVEIVEEVSEKLRLEVVKVSQDVIELKYMKPDRAVEANRSNSYEQKKSFELPKAYNKELIKAVKTMDPKEAKIIDNLVEKVEKNLVVLMDTMSDTDIQKMLQDDLNPQKLSIDMMTEIVKSNKTSFKIYDMEAIEADVSKSIELIEEKYTVDQRLEDIVKSLKMNDLPVSKKNVDRLIEASDKVDQVVTKLEDKWVNVLKIEDQPTLEKLYKATSIPIAKDKPVQMTEFEMKTMVKQHIQSLNLEISQDKIDVAVKMIKQDIPITKASVEFAAEPTRLIKDLPEIALLDKMALKIVLNKPVESVEVPVLESYDDLTRPTASTEDEKSSQEVKVMARAEYELSPVESEDKNETLRLDIKAKQLLLKLQDITHTQVIKATYKHENVNFQQIINEDKEEIVVKSDEQIPAHLFIESKSMVTRHRQVEEIRLKMTVEAAIKLESSGLRIETEPLEKVVNALRAYESDMVVNQSKAHQIHDAIKEPIAEEVVKVLEGYKQLKQMPEVSPAETIQIQETTKSQPTIEMLVQRTVETMETEFVERIPKEWPVEVAEAQEVRVEVEEPDLGIDKVEAKTAPELVIAKRANNAYEQSETQVRRDLGDRVENTFKQIQPMLESMAIEPTEEAVKAVEILARNEMPITEDNIIEIQLVQEKVDYITKRMNPRLALEMVKVGITPLDLNLDETIEIIEQYDQKFGETEAEKIGRLIHNLETDGLINDEQRESLMGIYRTFDTVVRSKGAATGFIVKNDMPLNIEQLFEAAKFIKKTGQIKSIVEVDVDDQFGRLTKLEQVDKSIKEQVKTAIDQLEMPLSKPVAEAVEVLENQEVPVTKTAVLSKLLMDMTLRSFVQTMNHDAMVEVNNEDIIESNKESNIVSDGQNIGESVKGKSDLVESVKMIPLKELEILIKGVLDNQRVLASAGQNISEKTSEKASEKASSEIEKVSGVPSHQSEDEKNTLSERINSRSIAKDETSATRKQIETITKFIRNNPEVVKQMIKNEIPMSPENIEKAIELNKEPFALLTKLRQMIDSVDNQEVRAEVVQKLSNTSREILSGEKSIGALKEALQEIELNIQTQSESVQESFTQTISDTAKTVTHTQMIQLTEDYYQIPIMMGNELSQLNMYILNNSEESLGNDATDMKVIMRFETKNLGPVTAYLELSGNQMNLNMQSANESDRALLAGFEAQIRALVDQTNFSLADVAYKNIEVTTPIESSQEFGRTSSEIKSDNGSFEVVV